jgi:hypothetical protein
VEDDLEKYSDDGGSEYKANPYQQTSINKEKVITS